MEVEAIVAPGVLLSVVTMTTVVLVAIKRTERIVAAVMQY